MRVESGVHFDSQIQKESEAQMATTSTLEPPARLNAMQRLTGVFFQPKATFADIAARPDWMLPTVLLCIASFAVIFTFTQRVGWHGYMEKQFAKSSRAQQMNAEDREKAIDMQSRYAPYFGYVFGTVGVALSIVVLAAVGLGAFNLTAGAQLKFKTCMAIVAYAWAPFLLAYILAIVVIMLKPPDMVDLDNLLASNPGAFLSSDTAKWLVVLLGSLDIFVIWTLLLQAVGYSTANPRKVSFGRALVTLIALWVLYVAVKVGWAAAFA
jgi:hypothetical protein